MNYLKIKYRRIKKVILITLGVLLFVPMFQNKFNLLEETPLNGDFIDKKKPVFSIKKWIDGSYQKENQEYINENFGFRNSFVRMYNQLRYSLFSSSRTKDVVVGNDDYLYGDKYISAYLGTDYVGDSVINEKVRKLKVIKDSLLAYNIDLVVVFAPGKGSYCSEYIKEEKQEKAITNYEGYKEKIERTDIRLLDLYAWFHQMKDTVSYPLFPKTGLHWSKFGEVLAADTIIRYLDFIDGRKESGIFIDSIQLSTNVRGSDDDIEKSMNLLFDIKDFEMAYPEFTLPKGINDKKVLTIADSYYWGMYNFGFSETVFNNGHFWYYFKGIYPLDSTKKASYVSQLNLKEELLNNDKILLLTTDANLSDFGFGFIEETYACFTDSTYGEKTEYEKRVAYYEEVIVSVPEWLNKIRLSAQKEGILLDSAIRKNARYMVEQEGEL